MAVSGEILGSFWRAFEEFGGILQAVLGKLLSSFTGSFWQFLGELSERLGGERVGTIE